MEIGMLLAAVEVLPPDSKLMESLDSLRAAGYGQVMVFTQYTDTMEFLRGQLLAAGCARLICYSGRGGEVPSTGGAWRRISRDNAKRRFREGEAEISDPVD